MKYNAHAYQTRATQFIEDNAFCALFLDMGLGKTVSTLTALDRLIYDEASVGKVLVIAPKSVAQNTWSAESAKWDHLNHLKLSIVMGDARKRRQALETEADIYVTNRDNVVWIQEQPEAKEFDCIVIDESSSFKNFQSKRFKALWKMRQSCTRMVLLTGTPAPNGLMDLWAQIKLLDRGERLGRFIGPYRETFFRAGARNGSVVYDWKPKPEAHRLITERISDICLSMQASDYLEMPMLIDAGMTIELPELSQYRKFAKDCIMDLPDGTEIMGVTAVAMSNKLLQFASGAVYDSEHEWHESSSAKLEAFNDLIEQTHESVLVFYNYQHERDRILQDHPEAVVFSGEPSILNRWNEGEIPLMLCHPASVAYGLNMQAGGHIIVWYSPTWNLELYQQANARLYRQGQDQPVIRYHLICKDTLDETVMMALESKDDIQDGLMKHLKSF